MKPKVYWFGPRGALSTVVKGQRLFELAGLNNCFSKGNSVAIKAHCGEWNNTGYLRPSIVAGIVEAVKEYGGEPFVCDTTTIYYTARGTAQDVYKTATRNGFTEATLGCPFIVADGTDGRDDVKVKVDGNFLKYTYIARAIAEADALIALTHFKGHPQGIIGGAMKNLGIGCCSKRGKSATHIYVHPKYGIPGMIFSPEKCKYKECPVYDLCRENCPTEAFQVKDDPPHAYLDVEKCSGCLSCSIRYAGTGCGVLSRSPEIDFESYALFQAFFVDSAKAVIETVGKKHVGFINYAIDISPGCDCIAYSDSWMLPNLGVFASKDILAVDKACIDAADKAEAVHGTKPFDDYIKGEPWHEGHEKFTYVSAAPRYPEVSQWIQINAGIRNKIGSIDYELVEATPGPRQKYVMQKYKDHPPGYYLRRLFRVDPPKPDADVYLTRPKITLEQLTKKP